jgi:hypothetical protein
MVFEALDPRAALALQRADGVHCAAAFGSSGVSSMSAAVKVFWQPH